MESYKEKISVRLCNIVVYLAAIKSKCIEMKISLRENACNFFIVS